MIKKQKVWLATATIVTSVGLLAGCGHTSSTKPMSPTNELNNTTNGTSSSGPLGNSAANDTNTSNSSLTNSSNTSGNTSTGNTTVSPIPTTTSGAFPSIVQQAMGQLPANVLTGAGAPTQVPTPATSASTVSYSVSHSTRAAKDAPKFLSTYDVTLKADGKSMASWYVTHYAASQDATKGYQTVAKATVPKSNAQAILLTGNQTAYVSNETDGSTTVSWTQGKWNVQVINQNTEVAPTPLADDVAQYIEKNTLPSPTGSGNISIISPDSSDTTVTVAVAWQNDVNLYQVATTSTAQDPVNSALAMATSMRAYSGK